MASIWATMAREGRGGEPVPSILAARFPNLEIEI
jgi:hypothetical protein